jgi:DNA-binding FadR family transcriptional regulator
MSTPVRGQNLTYSIANQIGIAVVTGVYSADNPIPIEAELCRQYGASRPVLREAVKMLTAKGLLGARPRRGTWVQPEDQWNLLDPDVLGWLLERKFSMALLMEFTEIRLVVEPGAAALAAGAAGPKEKAAIRSAIVRMQAADRGEDDPLDSDIAFHVAVLRGSCNRFYAQLSDFIATALRISIRMTNRYKGVRLASVADHQKVADAIISGKVDLAHDSMQKLIQEAMELIAKREAQERRAANRPQRAHST